MREHIIAVFDRDGPAAAAARALEDAGIPSSAIRRYAANDASTSGVPPSAVTPGSTEHGSSGGFWAWLLGEEGPSVAPASDYGHDPDFYDQRAKTGSTILAVTIADDSQIHRAMEIIESYEPVEIDEKTEEGASSSTASVGTASRYLPSPPSGSAEITSTGAYSQGAGRPASPAATGPGGEETIPLAEEQLEVGKRTVDRGTTRIRRYVVETPVEREVTLRGERVTIERRRPLGAQEGVGPGAFEERTVEVRETEEVPVAQKTAHVTEEVVVHREGTERTETVRDTVRREEVEVTPDTKSPDGNVR
jgi:uncharacterized protein (TIGR02271 family)